MQAKFRDDLDDFPLDDAPDPPRPVVPSKPGGRLAIAPERAVALFRQAIEAFDRADLLAAVSPLKDLRLFGISVRISLPPRPSGGPRHASRD